ncbi:MAG: efflux RND transporter periplasmic adaptor subunit [Planctomycetaceae bacterium]|nr:efflux RND transporter periplasmic adaptor subunit [Planctomycetaceae bacterium]
MSQATINQPSVEESPPPIDHQPGSKSQSIEKDRLGQLMKWIVGTVPTITVLVALGGVAWWGHHSDWQMPKFSAMVGQLETDVDDWCEVHGVPGSECVECLPTLLPKGEDYGWCQEHGVHQCPLCHPDVAELKTAPSIDDSQLMAAAFALDVRDRQENNQGCRLYRSRVQFTSTDAVNKAGVDFELVETRPMVEAVRASGEATYNETRVAQLASRVPGTVWQVERMVGDRVSKGDVLALIDAVDVGEAKSGLLDSLAQVEFHAATVERLKPLAEKQIIPGSQLLEAETALQQASIGVRRAEQTLDNLGLRVDVAELRKLPEGQRGQRLRFLGLPSSIRSDVSGLTLTNNLIPVVASLDGVVVERKTVAGEVVDPSQMLFRIADTSRMWLRFNVALEDAAYLEVGQAVRFLPDGMQDEVVGQISWVSTDVDKHTRTVEVRAEVENPDETLRNETFGMGRIILREAPDAVAVPKESVQWDGSCFVVFVRDRNYFDEDQPKIFHTRSVRPGVTADGYTEIIAGVLPGEVVVTTGSAVLRSQILKNNLGAGCTCGQ